MAIGTPTWATAVRVGASTAAATTASITPAGSDVALALISWQGNIAVGSAPTFTMTNGAGWGTLATAWTQLARIAVAMDNTTGYTIITEIWGCKLGASPSGGTVTATRSGSATDSSFYLEVGTVSGADVPGSPNNGTVHPTPNGTSAAVSLTSAPASTSMWAGVIGSTASTTITQPTGTTEANETIDSGFGVAHESAYKVGSASQSNSWSWSGGAFFGVVAAAVEIPVASGGSSNVSLTGAVSDLTTAAPAGTVAVTSDISLTGVVSDLTTAAPAGTVDVTTNVALTGAVADTGLAAPAGTVATVSDVTLTGAVADLALGAPVGTVSTGSDITLTGAIGDVALAAPAGTVTTVSNVTLTGAVADITLGAPAGTVSVGGDVTLTGAVADVAVTAPAGTVSIVSNAALTGAVADLTLAAPAGSVALDVTLTGPVAALDLAALAGTVSVATLVAVTGEVAGFTLEAPAGTFTTGNERDITATAVLVRTVSATLSDRPSANLPPRPWKATLT